MKMHTDDRRLVDLIPPLKRARGYYVYDCNGNRYLDLFQNGGHAVLGHRAQRVTTLLKSVMSSGLLFDLPSVYMGRLERALQFLFPDFCTFRIVNSVEAALQIASDYCGESITSQDVVDPALDQGNTSRSVCLWRPFLPGAQWVDTDVLLPVLPFSVGGGPVVVCLRKAVATASDCSELVSPLLLSGTARSIGDLARYQPPGWFSNDLLQAAHRWRQRSIYIVSKVSAERYRGVFMRFLKQGMLLSPYHPGPSILPAQASPGEVRHMITLFRESC